MRSKLLKYLVALVSCCFFMAVTETDIGSYHQTFFDDCDTYVPAEKQVVTGTHPVQKKQDEIASGCYFNQQCAAAYTIFSLHYRSPFIYQLPDTKKKLFLYNSCLLI